MHIGYEYHDLAYKIFRIGSFSYKTVFSIYVDLQGKKKRPKGTSLGKKNTTITPPGSGTFSLGSDGKNWNSRVKSDGKSSME